MSPHRTFHDSAARLWNAWDVIPSWGERRRTERRRASEIPHPSDRRRQERRHLRGIRVALPPNLAEGWIAFECGEERRRIAPIPPGWYDLSEDELVQLWQGAEKLPPRRKGLVE